MCRKQFLHIHKCDCIYTYRSVPGKRPWALKHNLRFWPAWVLTWDINSICLYGSCNSDPLKFGTWALTREWALARDTTVIPTHFIFFPKIATHFTIILKIFLHNSMKWCSKFPTKCSIVGNFPTKLL